MGRKYDFVDQKHQEMNDVYYQAPTCGELRKTLWQQHPFQWSKEDELFILEKLLEFSSQNKNNASHYTFQFYTYVNKMPSVQLSENQLCYMIYCLRKRYLEDYSKDDVDWNERDKVMELSKKIWGVDRKKGKRRDDYDKSCLVDYVVEELELPKECLTDAIVEEIKNDWEEFRFVHHQLRTMQQRFSLQLCQLKNNILNTQNSTSPNL